RGSAPMSADNRRGSGDRGRRSQGGPSTGNRGRSGAARKPAGGGHGTERGTRAGRDAGKRPQRAGTWGKDPARRTAFDVLRAVSERDAYANLLLPELLRDRRITGKDAALATELTYGTSRARGLLDEVIAACSRRPLEQMQSPVVNALRLGAYQLLRTRVAPHASVSATVDLVAEDEGQHATGFVNAVLRQVSEHDEETWLERLAPDPATDPIGNLALRTAHP